MQAGSRHRKWNLIDRKRTNSCYNTMQNDNSSYLLTTNGKPTFDKSGVIEISLTWINIKKIPLLFWVFPDFSPKRLIFQVCYEPWQYISSLN